MPATIIESRPVEASLTYFNGKDPNYTIDFTYPGGEERHSAFEKNIESFPVKIQDARGIESQFSLQENGFVYAKQKIDGLEDCKTEEEIQALVVPATEQLVKEVLGAHKTIVFTSRIRNVAEDTAKRADNRAPALSVHSDFSPAGARQMLPRTIPDAEERERLARGRMVLINVWRPLKTIKRDPLAVCDWASVKPETDMVPLRFVVPDSWSELAKWRSSEAHKWYYMSAQTPEEPLLFMQWDSEDSTGKNVAHTAFVDGEYADGPARESIEIKMAAFIE
ncbi:hypothetical protein N0V82_009023 [Gnomoniopsis sp. IMI 355080]|nr:hypothetical protein N0V82_009023 [Gnomoniopsis sp. IMI 355080]